MSYNEAKIKAAVRQMLREQQSPKDIIQQTAKWVEETIKE